MKQLILVSLLVSLLSAAYSQPTLQATLRRGSAANTTNILVKSSQSFSQPDEALIFSLAIPAGVSPAPTLGSSGVTLNAMGPVAAITGIQPSFVVDNFGAASREVVVSEETIRDTAYLVYTFIFAGTAATNHSWTVGEEQQLFSIAWQGCNGSCLVPVRLVSLPGGGSTRQGYWYFQANTVGDLTNYSAPFYSSSAGFPALNGGSADGSALSVVQAGDPIQLSNTTKQGQTIVFSPVGDKHLGDAPFTLSATASSGLPVSFSVLSGPATLAGNTVTLTGTGTVIIQASQTGNDLYDAAVAVNDTFRVLGPGGGGTACLPDIRIVAPSCSGKTTVSWKEPADTFPAKIAIPFTIDSTQGTMTLMGVLFGHGYYSSSRFYQWPLARDICKYIGGTDVKGHLVTITNAQENAFIAQAIHASNVTRWIGLYNTGTKANRFRWVTSEPLEYTNWSAGEPNNFLGNDGNPSEPYVHIYATDGTWNDQRSLSYPFVCEFDKTLLRYKHISGIKNNSQQKAGVYQVCYRRTNLITDQVDTCCFNVTVTCSASSASSIESERATAAQQEAAAKVGGLRMVASPNPSRGSFRVSILSNSQERVRLQVWDVLGRVVESRSGVSANQVVELGSGYRPGMYLVEVVQTNRRATVKLIKQSR